MNRKVFKAIGGGLLVGALAYFAPGVLAFMLLFFGLMMLFGRRRYRRYAEYRMAYAQKVRSMSDEEFQLHQEGIRNRRGC